jgi:radical SAM enzyme (TIGR01210 family)
MSLSLPANAARLDAWIAGQRPARNLVSPWRPYSFFAEDERSRDGEIVPVNTIFLTNRECPWRCLMCDLWKNTLTGTVPAGAIPAQIEYALARLPESRSIKLYNSGSFFDPHAIPLAEYPAIAARLAPFEHVVVESHPTLVGENCLRFRDMLSGRLEVAMGLETVHPAILPRLNKRMTLEQFAETARMLKTSAIDLRVFILVRPPFLPAVEAVHWGERSLDFAFECNAEVATLIPTRAGNGALEALALAGDFEQPGIATLEACLEYGLGLKQGRVFADLWELERFSRCSACYPARAARLQQMNLRQTVSDRVDCRACGAGD